MSPDIATIADGRRRRGLDNRARIVAAMLELVQSGEVAPSAEQVAARADVGLRTVFRHFQDMESLYHQMSVAIGRELRAIVTHPFRATDWKDRVVELVERRAYAFEKIGPWQRASAVARHRSKVLAADHAVFVRVAREILDEQLPSPSPVDALTLEALDLLLSFETWARLRDDQGLSAGRAREVVEAAVRRLLG